MLGLVGISYQSAPLELRERFVFCEEDIRRFMPEYLQKGMMGAVVLSTCNRTEIYFEIEDSIYNSLQEKFLHDLFEWRQVEHSLINNFYEFKEEEASKHLFRVAAGIESMALGEYQIVGQIKDALNLAVKHQICNSQLNRLFTKALETGKKVRTLTKLGKGAISVSSAAIELAENLSANLCEKNILLVGAGQTVDLTVQSLKKKKCSNVTIVNRTLENAKSLASKYELHFANIEELTELIAKSDIVISTTASHKPLITRDLVVSAINKSKSQKLLIDLSVPRNIEKTVDDLDNVDVYDIDDLNQEIKKTLGKREKEVIKAESIIDEMVLEFEEWIGTRNLSETFQQITKAFEKINQAELELFTVKTTNGEAKKASEYGEHITRKLARHMIQNVKDLTDNGRNKEYVELVNDLFKKIS